MRNATFLAVGFFLILLQSNLHLALGFIPLVGVTPNLIMPLVISLGVHEHSMTRGAVLTFVLGYLLDVLSGAPIGFFTFVHVACWWMARVAGVRLTAQTWLTRISLGFGFSIVESAITLILLAVFGSDTRRPVEIAAVAVPHAVSTAIVAPIVFRIAQKLHQASLAGGGAAATEGGIR
ncbi:MAG TPA: rod shape-determining protein MreD [Polyangiaceae bacterium]|nr:rod shape-determining protein MreD [Polyangiaceae bacterium]